MVSTPKLLWLPSLFFLYLFTNWSLMQHSNKGSSIVKAGHRRHARAMWFKEATRRSPNGSAIQFTWLKWLDLPSPVGCFQAARRHRISGHCANGVFVVASANPNGLSESTRKFLGQSYMRYSCPEPKSLLFQGMGANLMVPVTTGGEFMGQYSGPDLDVNISTCRKSMIQKVILNTLTTIDVSDFSSSNTVLGPEAATKNYQKYFNEATIEGSTAGSHYDWRFFSKLDYSVKDRQTILRNMIRCWFNFTNQAGIISWLAHGTLLGWSWNQKSLPWDADVDVQMSLSSLWQLSQYNQTLVVDVSEDSNGLNSYLLDVSLAIVARQKDGGFNAIDARFIDVDSGMYIDITGLSFTDSCYSVPYNEEAVALELVGLLGSGRQCLHEEYCELRNRMHHQQEIYNCKNNHFYSLNELQLVPTKFEGVATHVPVGWARILAREYPNWRQSRYKQWHFSEGEWRRG